MIKAITYGPYDPYDLFDWGRGKLNVRYFVHECVEDGGIDQVGGGNVPMSAFLHGPMVTAAQGLSDS